MKIKKFLIKYKKHSCSFQAHLRETFEVTLNEVKEMKRTLYGREN